MCPVDYKLATKSFGGYNGFITSVGSADVVVGNEGYRFVKDETSTYYYCVKQENPSAKPGTD